MDESTHERAPERMDFSRQAEEAAKHRLAGRLDEAEEIYDEIRRLPDALAQGIGSHHLGLCYRRRAESAEEVGLVAEAAAHHDRADAAFRDAIRQYEAVGDHIHVSAAMLDQGVTLLRRGQPDRAIEEIQASVDYLVLHRQAVEDPGFADEHLGIKLARLAEARLERGAEGDLDLAENHISAAFEVPQRNEYFVMVTEEIAGRIAEAQGDAAQAQRFFSAAYEKARQFGDSRRTEALFDRITREHR